MTKRIPCTIGNQIFSLKFGLAKSIGQFGCQCPNVSTNPITVMGSQQCLPLSVVNIAENPIAVMGL